MCGGDTQPRHDTMASQAAESLSHAKSHGPWRTVNTARQRDTHSSQAWPSGTWPHGCADREAAYAQGAWGKQSSSPDTSNTGTACLRATVMHLRCAELVQDRHTRTLQSTHATLATLATCRGHAVQTRSVEQYARRSCPLQGMAKGT